MISCLSNVIEEDVVAAYLLVYFKDETQGHHKALRKEGYHFMDVNNGCQVIVGDPVAVQKGTRDPHI
ncbi:hypothetical protein EL17_01840 [Anditalea andensis]|uniref:Uncharacterized protein n=1 Tax=Anditalea andensis TaxID=1048983 RepID=A0A074KZA1_9BACT|nr:hypothetical protein EL17_01840 [Anditalea andensis]